MDDRTRRQRKNQVPATDPDRWLTDVAEGASRDAGNVPVELLGDYLPLLADAAITGPLPVRLS